MTTYSLTTRAAKGSALTHTEMDANLTYFNNSKVVSVKDYGAVGDGVTDDTAAIQAAAAAHSELFFPSGTYLCGSAIFNGVPVTNGLRWIGESRGGVGSVDGTVIKYTGSSVCFKFQESNGSSERGGMVFDGLVFNATHSTAGMFQFNDPALTPTPTNDTTTPGFIREVRFNGCAFWGAGSATQGDAIKGVKLFELVIDENCYFRGWRRAVWLYGCDNNTLAGRYVINGRHIQIDSVNTFGNDNLITARWFGYTYNAGEDQYCLYDAGDHTTVIGTDFEPLVGATAAMYLNGIYCQYYSVDLQFTSSVSLFSLGEAARCLSFVNTSSKDSVGVPIISTATSIDCALSLGDFPGVVFVNPSTTLVTALSGVPRVMVQGGQARTTGAIENLGREVVTSNGIAFKKFVINATNYQGNSSGTGFSVPLLVSDAASYTGTAIKIKSVNLNGFLTNFTVGEYINNGDTIKITVVGAASAVPGAGTFRYIATKNYVSVANGALSTATSYTANTVTYTLSGFASGDTFSVGVYNSAVTDGTTYNIAAIIVEVTNPEIADTSGAALVDLETEVNKLKAVMRLFGLVGG